jgi:hydroxyacylglutathione hydrolase
MTNLEFHQFECLSDNYGVLIHDPKSGDTASIDAPDANAVEAALKTKGWKLNHILVTHHHFDHTQGIAELKSKYACHVIGPKEKGSKITSLDEQKTQGDTIIFGGETVDIIATPGHTLDMINFYFKESGVIFTGDTLFALGCGRIFEGDATMMWNSLSKLAELPPETVVYCGHEYTQANASFSLTIEPDNQALVKRAQEIDKLRANGKPTIPTTIAKELATNVFLRAGNATEFAKIRTAKDNA